MIDIKDFAVTVVRPTLAALGLDQPGALELIIGTAMVESGLVHLKQVSGPAIGVCQMEPATFNDCFTNYLNYKPELLQKVKQLALGGNPDPEQMAGNLYLAVAMCRIKYLRSPDPLPDPDDAAAMSHLHKTVYNSALGAANEAANISRFQSVLDTLH
jgi:hypothetical protein